MATLEQRYESAVRLAKRRIKSWARRGYNADYSIIPKRPKTITEKSIRAIEKINWKNKQKSILRKSGLKQPIKPPPRKSQPEELSEYQKGRVQHLLEKQTLSAQEAEELQQYSKMGAITTSPEGLAVAVGDPLQFVYDIIATVDRMFKDWIVLARAGVEDPNNARLKREMISMWENHKYYTTDQKIVFAAKLEKNAERIYSVIERATVAYKDDECEMCRNQFWELITPSGVALSPEDQDRLSHWD